MPSRDSVIEFIGMVLNAGRELSYLAGFAVMVGLGVAGLYEIGHGLWLSYLSGPGSGGKPAGASGAIVAALVGFELLLLAPLPIAIIIAITKYLAALSGGPTAEQEPRDEGQPDPVERALHMLHEAKLLITGLMVSVVATDLVKHSVQGDISLEKILGGVALMAALALFMGMLHVQSARSHAHRGTAPPRGERGPGHPP